MMHLNKDMWLCYDVTKLCPEPAPTGRRLIPDMCRNPTPNLFPNLLGRGLRAWTQVIAGASATPQLVDPQAFNTCPGLVEVELGHHKPLQLSPI